MGGKKWVNNYDPNSMLWISKAMDSFSMEKPDKEGKPCLIEGLKSATQPALVIGVQYDVLFPCWQQKEIADSLRTGGNKSVVYYELDSVYGHDAFLLEQAAIGPAVKGHLEQEPGGAFHLWQEMAVTSQRVLRALLQRGSTADAMRDMFRSLSENYQGMDVVEAGLLENVVKAAFEGRVDRSEIAKIFAEAKPDSYVTMEQWKHIWEAIMKKEQEVYLP